MKIFLPLFVGLLFVTNVSVSQDTKFKYLKKNDDRQEIVFSIIGIKNDNHAKMIMEEFEKFDQVLSCQIFYNKRCKLIVTNDVKTDNADKCREMLKRHNVDFDIDYIEPQNKTTFIELQELKENNPYNYTPNPVPASKWEYPADFPKYQDTQDPKQDKQKFAEAKQKWIETHPEEWKKMTGIEYLDYSVKINK